MPRRHIYITTQANATLEELCALTGKSVSETLSDAARFYRWSILVRTQGARLIVERDGKQREVVNP